MTTKLTIAQQEEKATLKATEQLLTAISTEKTECLGIIQRLIDELQAVALFTHASFNSEEHDQMSLLLGEARHIHEKYAVVPEVIYYVNLYTLNKAYGGPEEGGWWFTYGIYGGTHDAYPNGFTNKRSAYEFRNDLQEWVDKEEAESPNNHDLGSVNCIGHDEWIVQTQRGKNFPEVRPHYE